MVQTATTRQDQRQKPTISAAAAPSGVLIKVGAEIPQLAYPLRRVAGWNLIDGVNAYDLDASFREGRQGGITGKNSDSGIRHLTGLTPFPTRTAMRA